MLKKPHRTISVCLLLLAASACDQLPLDIGYGIDDAFPGDGSGSAGAGGTSVAGAGGTGVGGAGGSPAYCEDDYEVCLHDGDSNVCAREFDLCSSTGTGGFAGTGSAGTGSAGAGGTGVGGSGVGGAGAGGTGVGGAGAGGTGVGGSGVGGAGAGGTGVGGSGVGGGAAGAGGSPGSGGSSSGNECFETWNLCRQSGEDPLVCGEQRYACEYPDGNAGTGAGGASAAP